MLRGCNHRRRSDYRC